jgi:hypothetical protein
VRHQAVEAYRETFRERLLAAYALGSLAHGGFSPLVSDVDLAVVLDDPMLASDAGTVQDVAEEVKAAGFLAGIPATAHLTDPAVGSMRPAEGDAVEQLRRPDILLARGIRHVIKLVLFPVRFLYTAETGLVGTNEAAAQHYRNAVPPPPATELVAAALAWRNEPPGEEPATALLQDGMIPLYLHYIDDHVARLASIGRTDLADAFGEWRRRILARPLSAGPAIGSARPSHGQAHGPASVGGGGAGALCTSRMAVYGADHARGRTRPAAVRRGGAGRRVGRPVPRE